MTTPPTWRDLGRRARRIGATLQQGRHEAVLVGIDRDRHAIILRTAVAAALEQLEAGR